MLSIDDDTMAQDLTAAICQLLLTVMAIAVREKLREFGFTAKEAAIYCALLELGSSVVSDIAKRAAVKRSTAYVILDVLSGRGMVSTSSRRGVKLYQAAPAERLVHHLEGMAKRYAAFAGAARKLVPELKRNVASRVATPRRVQLFEGPEGIKTVYGETLSSLEKIRAHVSVTAARPAAGVAKEGIALKTEINVYDNKVVFISPAEQFAFVVESKELAAALKRAFVPAGKGLKRSDKRFVSYPSLARDAV